MREVRKTFSTSLIVKKESTATLSLYLRAVKDDGSSETLSKVADEMRTKLPQRINSVFSSRVSPVEMKKNQSKAVVIGTQEYIIDNIKQVENCIKTIPMHKFIFEGIQYEWQDGIYMMKVREIARGQSFGELALTTEGAKRSATIKCMTDCEFATLNKESFKRSMQSVEQNRIRKKIDKLQ
jgi:CRP-like cAMP-binding protein